MKTARMLTLGFLAAIGFGALAHAQTIQINLTGTTVQNQGGAYGWTITPQGTWTLQNTGTIYDHIEVDMGSLVNGSFVKDPNIPTRQGSTPSPPTSGSAWTAAGYTNLTANTQYTIQVRLYQKNQGTGVVSQAGFANGQYTTTP
jgi:hypothetical protein